MYGHPVDRCTRVKRFVQSLGGKIELFLLPPYAPELNPDEPVLHDLKNNGIGCMAISGARDMKQKMVAHLKRMQRMSELIRSFLRASTTSYAL